LTAGLAIETKQIFDELQSCLRDLPVRVVLEQAGGADDSTGLVERVEKLHPDVLIIQSAQAADRIENAIRKVKATSVPPIVIAVGSVGEPEMIVSAMRAGASEYLYPPLAEKLRTAIERISAARSELSRGARTLGFLSAKGGCGATTVACHLAMEFQRQTDQRVLLADLDLDAGMVQFFLKTKSTYSVLDAVTNVHRLDLNFWKALVSNGVPRLEVIAAPPVVPSRELRASEAFRDVIRFTRRHYDLVLVDLGRSLTSFSMTVLDEIDESFLITTLDVPALYRAKHVVETLMQAGYGRNRLRILVNELPKRLEVTLDEVEKMLGLPIYSTLPHEYGQLYEAYASGGLLPPASNLGRHLARLASKVLGIVPEEKPKKKFPFFA
jgi:pilus assembly protein CpaE